MEAQGSPVLEAEIEAVRTAEGYNGLNNFRAIMPGGYRYKALLDDPDFGNTKYPDKWKGDSLREFVAHAGVLAKKLEIDQTRVEQLQEEVLNNGGRASQQRLNDYIFPIYRLLRLEGFSHADCAG